MEAGMQAVSSAQVANIAENIIADELKRMRNCEQRRRLLGTRIESESDPTINDRITPGGLFNSSSTTGVSPGLSVILQTRHIFIRDGGADFVEKFFDLHNRYELLDTEGTRVLFAGETLEDFGDGNECLGAGGITFDVSLLSVHGGGVLNIRSNKAGVITISNFRQILGSILDIGGFCCYSNHKAFSIRDSNNCEIFKIHAVKKNVNQVMEFELLDKDMTKIGHFSKTWTSEDFPPHADIPDILYGVSFPQDMDINEKILLLGALFTLYFQHEHEGGHASTTNPKCVLFVYVLIAVAIFGLVVGLVIVLIQALSK